MKIGLSTALFITFLVLKLTNTVNWSWLWIFAPLWIPFSIYFLIFVVILFFFDEVKIK